MQPLPPTTFDHSFRPDCRACKAGQLSLCSKLDHDGLTRLQEMSRTRLFLKDAILSRQDEAMEDVFIILSGMVQLYQDLEDGRRQVTGFLGPGDMLGGIKREAGIHCTAQAITDVTACGLERTAFLQLVHDFPGLAFQLLIAATDEIEAEHDHVVMLGRRRPQERMAAFLLVLQHRWLNGENVRPEVPIPMSRADIADYLGLTVETVSRTLSRFKSQGLIELPDPHLAILRNVPALYDLAGLSELPVRGAAIGL
jgi:CRP/FNR family transcriptional regulator